MALNFANNNSLSSITALPASISGGSLNLISTQTASSSSSLSFTSGIDSTYKEYVFKEPPLILAGKAVIEDKELLFAKLRAID